MSMEESWQATSTAMPHDADMDAEAIDRPAPIAASAPTVVVDPTPESVAGPPASLAVSPPPDARLQEMPGPPPPPREAIYPTRTRGLTVHELDNEALIYDPETGDTHRLNETALLIWRLCDGGNDIEMIADRLADNYDVELDDAVGHVERLLAEFEERRLVTRGD
jgi:PqqD family protein of HPr-rel-A system